MYDYGYNYTTSSASNGLEMAAGAMIWIGIAAILALIGGIVAYYLFVKPKKTWDNKFLAWLKEFLRFNNMWIEGLLKVFYIIGAIFITLSAFAWFSAGGLGVLMFFMQLVFGNLLLRVIYEAALMKVMIWRNTTDINKKLK